MLPRLLEKIHGDDELVDALAYSLDFSIAKHAFVPDWFTVVAPESFAAVAEDGTGGVFLLGRNSERVLFVSSEGQAGVVARSLQAFLELMVAHPFWRDLLKFSGSGKLEEMLRAAPLLLNDFEDEDATAVQQRAFVAQKLGVQVGPRVVERLYEAVVNAGSDVTVVAQDGTQFDGLFNRFTVESNPHWRVA